MNEDDDLETLADNEACEDAYAEASEYEDADGRFTDAYESDDDTDDTEDE